MTENIRKIISASPSSPFVFPMDICSEENRTTLPFTDIPAGAWYEEGVRYAWRHGLMAGTSPTLFSPRLPLSRGMAVTILHRLESCPAPTGECRFSDVKPGYYWSEAVLWAAEKGIVLGCGRGKFRPEEPITREQLVALFYRLAQVSSGAQAETTPMEFASFADARLISRYALPAFQWALEQKLIQGTRRRRLFPRRSATRAQMAVLLHRWQRRDGANTI